MGGSGQESEGSVCGTGGGGMSADNWASCPKCEAQNRKDSETMLTKALASYGRVPAKQYEYDITAARKRSDDRNIKFSLREDYELGIIEDLFKVSYYGNCRDCGFEYSFQHQVRVMQ